MLTPYQTEKNEEIYFDECSQLRSTIERIGRRKNVIFKTKMCVSSQKIRMRKEEGATAASSPTFSQRAASLFRRAVGQQTETPNAWERLINYQKCPNLRNAGDFQTFIFIDSPKQMNQNE